MPYNQNGGQPSQRGGSRARTPKINEWQGEGIVKTRFASEGEQIRFYPFRNGGGAIHITVVVTEQYTDLGGAQRSRTTYVPVNVTTNANITQQQLQSVQPGMRVRVIGRLGIETYTSRRTNEKESTMVVNAFGFEILDMGQRIAAQGGYGQYAGGAQPQMQAQPQYGGGIPQPAPQQGYQPTQQPAPAYPAQQGGYNPQGGYGAQQQGGYQHQQQPQGGYGVQQPMQGQPAMQGGYGQQGMAQPRGAQRGNIQQAPYYQGAAAPAPAQGIEDMPDFGA